MNDDGLPDIALSGLAIAGDESVLMINNPKNPGQSFSLRSFGDGISIDQVAIADLNNDGRNDLAVTSRESLFVYLQDSQPAKPGNYTIGGTYDVSPETVSTTVKIVIAELNNDSLPDMAIASVGDKSWISVHIQDAQSNGEFLPAGYYKGENLAIDEMAIADLNNDMLPDIAVSHNTPNTLAKFWGISILCQDQKNPGTFLPSVTYPSETFNGDVALDDLNGDGLTDMVSFQYDRSYFSVMPGEVYIRFQDVSNPGVFSDPVVLP